MQRRVEHHPLLDPPLAGFRSGSPSLERGRQRRRLDLGEITEQPDVDTDDRHPGATEHLDGAQHRAVAAEAEGEPGRLGLALADQIEQLQRLGILGRHPRRVTMLGQPRRRLPGQCGGFDPLVVGHQQHIGHGADPDRPRRACTRNSRLPWAPVMGESIQPSTSQPCATSAAATSSHTR